jgi:cytoskeletal protein CcmA (bactofilin family)
MFSKPVNSNQNGSNSDMSLSPDSSSRKSTGPKVATLITNDITVEGNLTGDGELQVDCMIKGDVTVTRISIGDTGRIEGAVTAEAVEVRGRVTGSITAKQVRLYASAHLDGDLTYDQLTVEPGAFFEGRSMKLRKPDPNANQISPPPSLPAPRPTPPTE